MEQYLHACIAGFVGVFLTIAVAFVYIAHLDRKDRNTPNL